MSMFCYQCQEASKGVGCQIKGVCGKAPETATLQDLLLYTAKGVAWLSEKADQAGINQDKADKYLLDALFITITNATAIVASMYNGSLSTLRVIVKNKILFIFYFTGCS